VPKAKRRQSVSPSNLKAAKRDDMPSEARGALSLPLREPSLLRP
jgi:hypothetical protein